MLERQLLAATSRLAIALVLFMQAVADTHACGQILAHSSAAGPSMCIACDTDDPAADCTPRLSSAGKMCTVTQSLPALASYAGAHGFAPVLPLLALASAVLPRGLAAPNMRLPGAMGCSFSILFCSFQK